MHHVQALPLAGQCILGPPLAPPLTLPLSGQCLIGWPLDPPLPLFWPPHIAAPLAPPPLCEPSSMVRPPPIASPPLCEPLGRAPIQKVPMLSLSQHIAQ